MLTIQSCCTVSLAIPVLLTVKRQILHCSSWVNIPTLTQKTQLASILSIYCNIQHLAQPQSHHKLQWSMLRKRAFHHSRQANTANRHSGSQDDIIKPIMARAAWKQTESEPLGHCAACNAKWILWPRHDEKWTTDAMKRKKNGSRIMLREKLLWQESDFMMQSQWLGRSRKTQG